MKVAIVTWGSRGDYQPYLALAQGFLRRGHQVMLGAPQYPGFAEAADAQGVPFASLGPMVQNKPIHEAITALLTVMGDESALRQMYDQCLELARWADILVCHFFQPAGRMAAETLGRPFVTGTIVPFQIPSRYYPPFKLPAQGRWINRLSWVVVCAVLNAYCRRVNTVRRQVGLPSLPNLAGDGLYSPELNLVAASRFVTPAPPDWPSRHRLTGYWYLERPEWTPPPEVDAFVNREPRPIAIGFGSMLSDDSRSLTQLLVEAVRRSGMRAIIDPGWAGLGSEDLPSTVLCVAGVPHYWLFPRVVAAVHHGGAGTTAAAFRAGIPSVIVPHILDQETWADLAFQLGVSPRPVPRRDLTPERLAEAIGIAVSNPEIRKRATELGEAIRQEDGVGTAVQLVETYLAAPGRTIRVTKAWSDAGRQCADAAEAVHLVGNKMAVDFSRQRIADDDDSRSGGGPGTMGLMRRKGITLGGLEFSVAVEARRAERLKHTASYRYVLGPAMRLLESLGDKRNGHGHPSTVAPVPKRAPVALAPPSMSPEAQAILDQIKDIEWYHSIDLPHGVTTPGFADHRGQVSLYQLPEDMRGLRALDVATYDGFWAFEMERRGAEVVAIDIATWSQFDLPQRRLEAWRRTGAPDKPTGRGFQIAHDLLGSRVERQILSIYELSPDKLGTFDVVFLSDLLLHLRDPQRALENVGAVVRSTGFAIIADVYQPRLEAIDDMLVSEYMACGNYVWWRPSVATLKAMMRVAGFGRIDEVARFTLASTSSDPIYKVVLKGYPVS
ncbi:MAG TPA: nucleotide disphospho-sugar-binding domain-containing protein [Chloroflexota bacterium]|nr:nucleotide disphospho-sugar-binding domain-containing protein [Chloroflexota bacterium]